jgi:uncharacterized membrane protein YcaP (DUF421 family)
LGIAFIRTIILYVFVVAAVRIMGKRQIGELQPSELVVAILISELAAIPMQETGIPLMNGIIPILTLISCEILLSAVTLFSTRLRRVFSGSPSILIKNGVINQEEMRRLRFSIDDLMEELRLCGYMNVDEVSFAVLETNGKLSVFPEAGQRPVTTSMMNLNPPDGGLPSILICDGMIFSRTLSETGKDQTWLLGQLSARNFAPGDVFLMTVDSLGKVIVIPKQKAVTPPGAQK